MTGAGAEELARLPVSFVTFNDALAYCAWVGAFLPSEEQYEFLLRSAHGTSIYPWGDESLPPPKNGNYADESLARAYDGAFIVLEGYRDGHDRASPVASYRPDRHGIHDISGNVSEWCRGPFVPYGVSVDEYYAIDHGVEASGVLRGGNFFQHPRSLRCSWRRQANRHFGREFWGFRCVRPVYGP
jgi:formylglycine-generating enzyme required for sulfatase activity